MTESECEYCKKYEQSFEGFKRAVSDGKIPTSVYNHAVLYSKFKAELAMTGKRYEAIINLSIKEGCSERHVYNVIKEHEG